MVTKVTKAPKVDQEKVYNAFMKENILHKHPPPVTELSVLPPSKWRDESYS